MTSQRRQPRPLASQFLTLVAVLVIGLGMSLVLIFGSTFRQHAHARTAKEVEALAARAAQMMADGVLQRSREMAVIAQSSGLWSGGLDSPAVTALLDRARAVSPNSLWIGVADKQGTVVAATGNVLLGQNVAQRPWFARGMEGLHVGDVHPAVLLEASLSPLASREPLRFVDFAAPIQVEGKTVGVLCTHFSWDWARQVSERVLPIDAQSRGIELLIFDARGELLYAPYGQTTSLRANGQRLPMTDSQQAPAATAQVFHWTDNQPYLTSSVRMGTGLAGTDLGWRIVARAHYGKSFEPARTALLLAGGAGLAVACVICAIAWRGARRLGADLRLLAQATRRIEAGATDVLIPEVRSSGEVQTLSRALVRMTHRLAKAHADMESQVAERTMELEAANRSLEQLMRHDALTGVLNRRGFEPKGKLLFDLARRGGRPLSACMIDADHFKIFNDTYGHAIGDEVLKFIANCLCSRMRRTDVLARWGGEEFMLLLPDTSLDKARMLAEDLCKAVEGPTHAIWGRVTVSVGLVQGTADDESLEALIARADQALYRAKHLGRNQVSTLGTLI